MLALVGCVRKPGIPLCGPYGGAFQDNCSPGGRLSHPTSSNETRRLPVPWSTDKCGDAIRARRRALRHFQAHPAQEKFIAFKRLLAVAHCTIREAKHASWRSFVSSRTLSIPSDIVWKRLVCMPGKSNRTSVRGISLAAPFLERSTSLPAPSLQTFH